MERTNSMCNILTQSTRALSSSRTVKFGLVCLILVALYGELRTVLNEDCLYNDSVVNTPTVQYTISKNNLAPGELPGYTGWARPEKTLARYFTITHTKVVKAAYPTFMLSVECSGHEDCVVVNPETQEPMCPSTFYFRAYGPAVVPGVIHLTDIIDNSKCLYKIGFNLHDSGTYTIEAVLTLSNPPPISSFPLESNQEEPKYEGYLLPGFPISLEYVEANYTYQRYTSLGANKTTGFCQFEDLTETKSWSAWRKARWKVTGRVNEKDYWSKTMNSTLVSTMGYKANVNSLGIQMEYQYFNKCHLIDESWLDTRQRDKRPTLVGDCHGPQDKLHIVYIGDSVLRVQKDMLQQFLKGIPSDQVELTFLSLHGGYRKNQRLGPNNVTSFLQDVQTRTSQKPNQPIVILFNTGLHDIHRLCGAEFREERPTYLDETFNGCTNEYILLLRDFLNEIQKFPAALKVFQTTTAAWPKYGNYGIQWPTSGQSMVLTLDFIDEFNLKAFHVLEDYPDIHVMDGYWITYPRPDNREVGDIGKKLSHPGVEVLSAMTRKWVMLMQNFVCFPLIV